jgi:hypothetical protein
MSTTTRKSRKGPSFAGLALVSGTVLVLLAAVALLGPDVGAQTATPPRPPVVTDYANYPLGLGIVPSTCTTQAPATLTGVQFAIDGGAPFSDLRTVSTAAMNAGHELSMTWTGFAPGCEGIGVGLSKKISQATLFSLTADQWAQVGSYCGPGGDPCTAPYRLTIPIHPAKVPCYQIDAHLGPLLLDVGPSGAFYTNPQFTMLISAFNGGIEPCAPEPCPENPKLPKESLACVPTTTTTTSTTTSTTTPSSTTTTTTPSTTTTAPPPVFPPTTPPPAPPTTLPTTGRSEAPISAAGVILLVGGAAFLTVGTWLRGTGRARHRNA